VSAVSERDALMTALRDQREHVLRAVAGLSNEALRQPVLPSGWTCLGLIQHLALDVERFWFRAVLAGQAVQLCAWRRGLARRRRDTGHVSARHLSRGDPTGRLGA
jgi:hypothetical protein